MSAILDPIKLKARCDEAVAALASRSFPTAGHKFEFVCAHVVAPVCSFYVKQGHRVEDVRAEIVAGMRAAGYADFA